MSLTAGIIGLPNVGKSTLFNAITKSQVEAANYPFATIKPNVKTVEVPDERVDKLSAMFNPRKTIRTTFEFTDIAGLVRGASKGEGLGNQFLGHIREVDAICHVVRCFDDNTITHVENSVDPKRDIEIVNIELSLADLDTVQNRISKVERKAQSKEKDAVKEYELLLKLKKALEEGKSARSVELNEDEKDIIKSYNLLTIKPVIYIANMSESEVSHPEDSAYYQAVKAIADEENNQVIAITAKTEEELAQLDDEDKAMFLEELGLKSSGLDEIIVSAYSILNLCTFLTVGTDEVRAWTFTKGMKAPDCAGIIHSDFKKGFIRAEVYSYDDIMKYGSEVALKEAGKLRVEGKDYVVQDGDIMHIRFNV
ncbi:MAG: redox-regulated ATPase YchF [Erysipelotrichaceae bacterium]|nr:redox-regulated ATPase YchF [Erysipelotrichaceae bacterium]